MLVTGLQVIGKLSERDQIDEMQLACSDSTAIIRRGGEATIQHSARQYGGFYPANQRDRARAHRICPISGAAAISGGAAFRRGRSTRWPHGVRVIGGRSVTCDM